MTEEEFKQFWKLKVMPLWDAHKTGMKSSTEKAERYLVDILKLIISLSTGLLAFMVAIQNSESFGVLNCDTTILLYGFIFAIVFSVLSLVLLAINYKKFADDNYRTLQNLYIYIKNGNYEEVSNMIQKNENLFFENSDRGWQIGTIVFAVISVGLFILCTFYLVGGLVSG